MRSLSMQQRLICEYLEKHPGSTSAACGNALSMKPNGMREKLLRLIATGHVIDEITDAARTYTLTGKEFPRSTEYTTRDGHIAAKLIEQSTWPRWRIPPLDEVASAFHAMVSTGRQAAA